MTRYCKALTACAWRAQELQAAAAQLQQARRARAEMLEDLATERTNHAFTTAQLEAAAEQLQHARRARVEVVQDLADERTERAFTLEQLGDEREARAAAERQVAALRAQLDAAEVSTPGAAGRTLPSRKTRDH